jgi:excisionase family DNA binding protein
LQLKKLLSVRDTAERLGMAEVTIRIWLAQRKLEYVKLGRATRIPESEIQRLIEAGTVPAQA